MTDLKPSEWIQLVAALGTWAAVMTALWLAGRDRRVKLRVTAGVRKVVPQVAGVEREYPEVISVMVTNEAHRSVLVKVLAFVPPGGMRRKGAILLANPDPKFSSKLPTRLADGDEAIYSVALESFDTQVITIMARDHLPGCCPALKARFINVFVETSRGERFYSKLEKPLRDLFIAKARALRSADVS